MSDDSNRRGVTRRTLIKGAGMAAAAGSVLRPLEALADEGAAGPRTQGPDAVDVKLRVNGAERTVKVEPRHTLLDTLRLPLDLTGAKPRNMLQLGG